MDIATATEGLKKLVTQHHTDLLEGGVVFQVLLDEDGNVVSHENAIKVSSTRKVTTGGLETFNPQPGEGFYACMHRGQERVERDMGIVTTWSVYGPDWRATVTIVAPVGNCGWTVTPAIAQPSADGVKFLSKFA